jgi:hypothetical protein
VGLEKNSQLPLPEMVVLPLQTKLVKLLAGRRAKGAESRARVPGGERLMVNG